MGWQRHHRPLRRLWAPQWTPPEAHEANAWDLGGQCLGAWARQLPPARRNALAERLAHHLGALWPVPADAAPCPLPASPYRARWQALWRLTDGGFAVALADPFDLAARDALRLILEAPVRLALAWPEPATSAQFGPADPNVAPVVAWIDALLSHLTEAEASDLHLERQGSRLRLRARQDGQWQTHPPPPGVPASVPIAHLKSRAGLDPHEQRRPQDGRFAWWPTGAPTPLDLRLACLPTHGGESLVLRLLHGQRVVRGLDQLGLDPATAQALRAALRQRHGLILAVGPTGSGKTTTLYALLAELDRQAHKVLTVEDPVEYALPGAIQVNVQAEIGLDFATVLRSMLRHDPDQLLVGEIRDRETAQIALQAGLTGHLVLSSLHAGDAPGAILRLRDLGLPPFLVAGSLIGIIGQRLVRRRCACGGDPACTACMGSGFAGRLGLFEWLAASPDLRSVIARGASYEELCTAAVASGWQPLEASAQAAVAAGWTTADEVARLG